MFRSTPPTLPFFLLLKDNHGWRVRKGHLRDEIEVSSSNSGDSSFAALRERKGGEQGSSSRPFSSSLPPSQMEAETGELTFSRR